MACAQTPAQRRPKPSKRPGSVWRRNVGRQSGKPQGLASPASPVHRTVEAQLGPSGAFLGQAQAEAPSHDDPAPALPMPAAPKRRAALEQYRRRAGVCDLEPARFEPVRREAIANALAMLRPGARVAGAAATARSHDLPFAPVLGGLHRSRPATLSGAEWRWVALSGAVIARRRSGSKGVERLSTPARIAVAACQGPSQRDIRAIRGETGLLDGAAGRCSSAITIAAGMPCRATTAT